MKNKNKLLRSSSEAHSFNANIASLLKSERKAILLKEIWNTCQYFARQEKNIHFGYVWYFDSARALHDKFIYISKGAIARHLKELEQGGFIVSTDQFNRRKSDRTKWYTINLVAYELGTSGLIDISHNENWAKTVRQTISQNETGISQNETGISQNETGISQNETTLPPSTTPSTTPNHTPKGLSDFDKVNDQKNEKNDFAGGARFLSPLDLMRETWQEVTPQKTMIRASDNYYLKKIYYDLLEWCQMCARIDEKSEREIEVAEVIVVFKHLFKPPPHWFKPHHYDLKFIDKNLNSLINATYSKPKPKSENKGAFSAETLQTVLNRRRERREQNIDDTANPYRYN